MADASGDFLLPDSATCQPANIHIHGESLAPRVSNGALLPGHIGDCPAMRNGLALFRAGGHILIKIVTGLPGDRFDLQPAPPDPNPVPPIPIAPAGLGPFGASPDGKPFRPEPPGQWNLLINGAIAKNSRGVPYRFGFWRKNMLALYARDHDGVIPPESYLLLGDDPTGTSDSTKFGLISRTDIIGTVP